MSDRKILPGDQTHDVEGHVYVESEDVEGHVRMTVTNEEGDVDGHVRMTITSDDEDVEGHVQPRRDIDIER